MTTREKALRHSPTIWGLYSGGAAFVGIAVATIGWNLWEHRADVRQRLRL